MEIPGQTDRLITAKEAGLVACRRCSSVWPVESDNCARCGAKLQSRDGKSLQRVWGWWLAGVMCYVPANLYPMLETRTLLFSSDSTIVGGAIELMQHGSIGIAIVIFVASVLIPIGKFMAIAILARSVARPSLLPSHLRHGLFEIIEYVGRWSMIDVFVVAILASLVQLNVVVSIKPGPASLTFAISVIFTMFSAQSIDPRLIWDQDRDTDRGPE